MSDCGIFDWPDYYLDQAGFLREENGAVACGYDGSELQFENSTDAEQYLIDNNIRGQVV